MGQPPPDPALTLHSVDESDLHVEASQALPPVISLSKDDARPMRLDSLLENDPKCCPEIVIDIDPVGIPFDGPPEELIIGEL